MAPEKVTLVSSHPAEDGRLNPDTNLSNPMLKAWIDSRDELAGLAEVRNIFQPLNVGDVRFSSDLAGQVLSAEPDIVGLSCWVWDIDAMLDLAPRLKAEKNDVKIVVGGQAATARAREILERNPAVDVVVSGEGEVPFAELIRHGFKRLQDVQGTTFRDGSEIHEESPPFYFADLSELPSPFAQGPVRPLSDAVFIEIGRGCPCRCAFCHRTGTPERIRKFPMERITTDIRWACENGIRVIRLTGLSIRPSMPLLREIADETRNIYGSKEFKFACNVDFNYLEPEGFEGIKDIPFDVIRFSINTINADSLELIDRKIRDLGKLSEVLGAASRISPVGVDVMMGLPGDSFNSFKQSLDWVMEANRETSDEPWEIVVNWVIAVPGSPLGDRPEDFGIRRINSPGTPYILETDTFSFDDIKKSIKYVYEKKKEFNIVFKGKEVGRNVPEIDRLIASLEAEKGPQLPGTAEAKRAGRLDLEKRVTGLLKGGFDDPAGRWRLVNSTREGDGVVLRFDSAGSDPVELFVSPRDESRKAYARTEDFNICIRSMPDADDIRMVDQVKRILARRS